MINISKVKYLKVKNCFQTESLLARTTVYCREDSHDGGGARISTQQL